MKLEKRVYAVICGIMLVSVIGVMAGCTGFFLDPKPAASAGSADSIWKSIIEVGEENNKRTVPTITQNRPTFIVASYAHPNKGGDYERAWNSGNFDPEEVTFFEGGLSPRRVWEMIPDDIKPYTLLSIHPNFMWGRGETNKAQQKRWIEDQLGVCQKYNIPVILVMQSAWTWYYCFNTIYPYSGNKEDEKWIDMIVEKYPCLQGFNATEEHHENAMTIAERVAKWTRYCAEKSEELDDRSLTFFLFDSHSHFFEYPKHPEFKEMLEKYGRNHFVYGYKDTLKGNWHPMYALSQGAWLNGDAAAFGGLTDTWTWNMRGWTEMFSSRRGSYGDNWYQTMSYPEGFLFIYMLMMYANGATVFNFEIPFHVEGNALDPSDGYKTHVSECMANVFIPTVRFMTGSGADGFTDKHPAPSKAYMIDNSKVIQQGNWQRPDAMQVDGDGDGWGSIETNATGQYGMLPYLTNEMTIKDLKGKTINNRNWNEYPRQTIKRDGETKQNSANASWRKAENQTDSNGTWYVFNYWVNPTDTDPDVNRRQYAKLPLDKNGDFSKVENSYDGDWVELSLTPHTGVYLVEKGNKKYEVFMSNYRLNKDHVFQESNHGLQNDWKFVIPNMTTDGKYTADNIAKGRTGDGRKTFFTFNNDVKSIKVLGAQNNVGKPSVRKNEKELVVTGNGWVHFEVEIN